jgi:hypothetical protein
LKFAFCLPVAESEYGTMLTPEIKGLCLEIQECRDTETLIELGRRMLDLLDQQRQASKTTSSAAAQSIASAE